MKTRWLIIGIALAAIIAVGAVACGDDEDADGDGDGAVATATTGPSDGDGTPLATEEAADATQEPTEDASAGVTLIVTENADLGPILTDPAGNTLYVFANDEPGVSNCLEGCTANWPPLLVLSEDITGGEGVVGEVSTTVRPDGGSQVTYDGAPLYYYNGDEAPGDTNGDGVAGLWSVVRVE